MKQSLKHIAMAAMSAAFVAAASSMAAQNLAPGEYKVVNGIAYNKSAVDNLDGTFTVDLEAFVTGTVKIPHSVKPTDVVLVLDISGSMKEAVPNTYMRPTAFAYSFVNMHYALEYGSGSATVRTYYYFYKEGEGETSVYYPLNVEKSNSRYYVYYTKNNVKYYLRVDGTGADQKTNTSTWATQHSVASQTARWPVVPENVYRYKGRFDILKEASTKFIDVVKYNDDHDPDGQTVEPYGHRIAIVTFGTGASTVVGLTEVANGGDVSIKTIINQLSIPNASHTEANKGMSNAKDILQTAANNDPLGERSRFAVFFTDGNPSDSSGNTDFGTPANEAIGYAKVIKNTDGSNAINGVVFSIGMIAPSEATDNTNRFLNFVSSNYPSAADMSTSQGDGTWNGDYYKAASGADLSAIFEAIAEQATGGSENTSVTAEATSTVDVVSDAFEIPSSAAPPQVLIAPLTGQTQDPVNKLDGQYVYYTFGEAKVPSEYLPSDEAALIQLIPDSSNPKKLSSSGFDYSTHWCGKDEASPTGYHQDGYKLIIRFTVTPSSTAVGGPDTATNTEESGIYVNGEKIASFNKPTVRIPVSIWIKKEGLKEDDSAVFTIYYADPSTSANEGKNPHEMTYQSFTKVVVNNSCEGLIDGESVKGVVKLTGLDSQFYYRIREDAWTWTYNKLADQYTSDVTTNPIVFTNTPKDSNVKQGENFVTNTFHSRED